LLKTVLFIKKIRQFVFAVLSSILVDAWQDGPDFEMSDPRRNTRQSHLSLAQQILHLALERGMKRGDHLPEFAFSQACNVSRTPIRSAFKLLEDNDIIERRDEGGYILAVEAAEGFAVAVRRLQELEGSLASRILADRGERRIGDVQSVSALVRRYEVSRNVVLNALKILSNDGLVAQLPGRAWAFQPMLDSPRAIDESFAMRLLLEPQAILAPGFALDAKRVAVLRSQMDEVLHMTGGRMTAAGFRRLDTEFHTLIAECSGNRFVRGALLAHHKLRSATQKETAIPEFRLKQSLQEHQEILDSLERNQFDLAADQMVLHLRRSRIRRPEAANRGIPPLVRGPRA
jgi:DNA-binding GntR family transcriptional regulator